MAVCFGVFVCQDVAGQSLILQNTPITKQVGTPTNGGNTTNSITISPNSGVTKQTQQAQFQSINSNGSAASMPIVVAPNDDVSKQAQQVQFQSINSNGSDNNREFQSNGIIQKQPNENSISATVQTITSNRNSVQLPPQRTPINNVDAKSN